MRSQASTRLSIKVAQTTAQTGFPESTCGLHLLVLFSSSSNPVFSCYKGAFDFISSDVIYQAFRRRIRLNLVKHLKIKISERSFTQRFDDFISSFSSEENQIDNLIYHAR